MRTAVLNIMSKIDLDNLLESIDLDAVETFENSTKEDTKLPEKGKTESGVGSTADAATAICVKVGGATHCVYCRGSDWRYYGDSACSLLSTFTQLSTVKTEYSY